MPRAGCSVSAPACDAGSPAFILFCFDLIDSPKLCSTLFGRCAQRQAVGIDSSFLRPEFRPGSCCLSNSICRSQNRMVSWRLVEAPSDFSTASLTSSGSHSVHPVRNSAWFPRLVENNGTYSGRTPAYRIISQTRYTMAE